MKWSKLERASDLGRCRGPLSLGSTNGWWALHRQTSSAFGTQVAQSGNLGQPDDMPCHWLSYRDDPIHQSSVPSSVR